MCHLDHHRKFPTKILGRKNWIQMLQGAANTSNESNHNQKPNYQVRGHEFTKRCVLTPQHVENDQTGTGRLVDRKEEHEIDFRVPGQSHAVIKEAEHLLVQELVKRIENHPHRGALHADLQQNNVYNPFSDDSKAMIRELGDVELIELCEYQKYNVLAVFFVGIKELCTALADDA